MSGTSMAAPHVAGAAALLASGTNFPQDADDVQALRRVQWAPAVASACLLLAGTCRPQTTLGKCQKCLQWVAKDGGCYVRFF
jgi:subtilisin family serine protease